MWETLFQNIRYTLWDSMEFTYDIIIDDLSGGEFVKVGNATKTVSGKARIKGDRLKIGLKGFSIDQFPTIDTTISSSRFIILDGITYYEH